ncbi:arylesterase [Sphingomonas oleivorans]|uniref:arylesterase n=1 Tax=Sphingomonas oleivorans TaxID=1735121 RepID=UPI001FAFEF25|nr:arylesterase [Sphingomonas oleivorans]
MKGFPTAYGARRLLVHAAAFFALAGAVPAVAAEKLVLAFGDSLTAGYGLKPGQGFADQLQAALRRDGIAARVHNAGVSGDTTAGGKARLGWVLTGLKLKPDLAIVELGANDMLRGLPPEQARANLEAILAELQRRKIPVLLAGMLASPNLGADYRRRFDSIYPALARRYNVRLYPFFLNGVTGQPGMHIGDRMHPNMRGVAVIVKGILPQVKAGLGAK